MLGGGEPCQRRTAACKQTGREGEHRHEALVGVLDAQLGPEEGHVGGGRVGEEAVADAEQAEGRDQRGKDVCGRTGRPVPLRDGLPPRGLVEGEEEGCVREGTEPVEQTLLGEEEERGEESLARGAWRDRRERRKDRVRRW